MDSALYDSTSFSDDFEELIDLKRLGATGTEPGVYSLFSGQKMLHDWSSNNSMEPFINHGSGLTVSYPQPVNAIAFLDDMPVDERFMNHTSFDVTVSDHNFAAGQAGAIVSYNQTNKAAAEKIVFKSTADTAERHNLASKRS